MGRALVCSSSKRSTCACFCCRRSFFCVDCLYRKYGHVCRADSLTLTDARTDIRTDTLADARADTLADAGTDTLADARTDTLANARTDALTLTNTLTQSNCRCSGPHVVGARFYRGWSSIRANDERIPSELQRHLHVLDAILCRHRYDLARQRFCI